MFSCNRKNWRERVGNPCNNSSWQKHIACRLRTPGLPRARRPSNSLNLVAIITINTLQISMMMTSRSWKNRSHKEAKQHQRLTFFLVSLTTMIRKRDSITTLMEQRKVGREKLVGPNNITVQWRTIVCSRHSNLLCEIIQGQQMTTSITTHSTSMIRMRT